MYKTLMTMTKRPALWQRSDALFWDDEHISKGMLEMHLNPDLELASRKAETIEQSVAWLASIIKNGSKILDLGCGPGLYTKKLAALGYEMTGVDYSKRSIAYAKEQDKESTYNYQNYLELAYEESFDAIILIYCDYAALTEDERAIVLKNVHRALKPNGLFIFDVFSESSSKNEVIQPIWNKFEEGDYWSPEPHICLEAVHHFEKEKVNVNQYVVITENEAKEYLIWNTSYNLERLAKEVVSGGLEVVQAYDDVCGKAYTGESSTICLVARKSGV